MSSQYLNPRQQKAEATDWARLIPGQASGVRAGARKPPQSVRAGEGKVAEIGIPATRRAEDWLGRWLPRPLQGRMAQCWLWSVAADYALIAVNWLLLGAALVVLHGAYPSVGGFAFAAGAPASLLGFALLHAALITLVGFAEGLYSGVELAQQKQILMKAVSQGTGILCVAFATQRAWSICAFLCGAGGMNLVALGAWRWRGNRMQRSENLRGDETRNVLIVGASVAGKRLAAHIDAHPEIGRTVCGFLDDCGFAEGRVVGRVSDLARLARIGFVDEVILSSPIERDTALRVVQEARRLRLDVVAVPELFGCTAEAGEFERIGDFHVVCLHAERLPATGLIVKRLLDVAGSCAGLVMLSPLLAAIAWLIRLDSPGPVLYAASRAGRKGRTFRCFKFRTMMRDADKLKDELRCSNQRSGPFFKIADDPRITRVGRFLRRYSLDELPQLWNVLKGEMSLVGPRPHPLDDFAAYQIEHLARLDVTPGITGLWQVMARRDPSFEHGMELDREYIRTWSLTGDLRILGKTLLAVAAGSGD